MEAPPGHPVWLQHRVLILQFGLTWHAMVKLIGRCCQPSCAALCCAMTTDESKVGTLRNASGPLPWQQWQLSAQKACRSPWLTKMVSLALARPCPAACAFDLIACQPGHIRPGNLQHQCCWRQACNCTLVSKCSCAYQY